jgi:hypothetical protein
MSAFGPKQTFDGYSVGTLLAAITSDVVGLILIAADATEREHRKG